MHFSFHAMNDWPPLAWLARCEPSNSDITVFHGPGVDTGEEWFCEAVWAGDYGAGDFDQTDIIAGSGARLRNGTLVFVSSGATHDRLHSYQTEHVVRVSNSLCCLLTAIDASADLAHTTYQENFASFRDGLDKHIRDFPTSAGPVQLTYFNNLVWDGSTLEQVAKPGGDEDFGDFSRYRNFLADSMKRFTANASDTRRRKPYKLLCAISNGYDSPTVAALASEAGCQEAMTIFEDRDGGDDSGEAIAKQLGLQCHLVTRDAWQSTTMPEVPFIACSGSVGDLAFKSAEPLLTGKVLLTGLTCIWDMKLRDSISDGSGLGLTEYRLWADFIHCPLSLWGIRQYEEINEISNSAEMTPWHLEGRYSRPICRRIVEEAGIPRDYFGMGDRGLSVSPQTKRDFITPSSRQDFMNWLAERRQSAGISAHHVPSPRLATFLDGLLGPLTLMLRNFSSLTTARVIWRFPRLTDAAKTAAKKLTKPYYHHKYVVHWAIDRAKQRYTPPPQ